MVANDEAISERGAWREVPKGWRQLWGDFDRLGVSLQWHDFRTERSLDWGASFRPRSLEFCLNVEGRGAVGDHGEYVPSSAGYYAVADQPLRASRQARDHHQFVTVEFSKRHLQQQLADCESDLDPQMRSAIFPQNERSIVSPARPMTTEQRQVVTTLLDPPVSKLAQSLWYQSKALELMSHFLFTPKDPEFFCMRQKRVARDRDVARLRVRERAAAPEPAAVPDAPGEVVVRTIGLTKLYGNEPVFRDLSAVTMWSCARRARDRGVLGGAAMRTEARGS